MKKANLTDFLSYLSDSRLDDYISEIEQCESHAKIKLSHWTLYIRIIRNIILVSTFQQPHQQSDEPCMLLLEKLIYSYSSPTIVTHAEGVYRFSSSHYHDSLKLFTDRNFTLYGDIEAKKLSFYTYHDLSKIFCYTYIRPTANSLVLTAVTYEPNGDFMEEVEIEKKAISKEDVNQWIMALDTEYSNTTHLYNLIEKKLQKKGFNMTRDFSDAITIEEKFTLYITASYLTDQPYYHFEYVAPNQCISKIEQGKEIESLQNVTIKLQLFLKEILKEHRYQARLTK